MWADRLATPVDIEVGEYLGQPVEPHAVTLRRGQRLIDPDTGQVLCVVAAFPGDLERYRWAVRTFPQTEVVRAQTGMRNRSTNFGYVGRRPVFQVNACHTCQISSEAPEQHAVIAGAAEELMAQYRDAAPDAAAADAPICDQVLPDWRLGEDVSWTSGVVNFDSPLPYHVDRNNFDSWSAMVSLRRGIREGHLHLPGLAETVDCADGDVVYMNFTRQVHGVTPIRRLNEGGYRITAVYYAVRRMADCLPIDEEMAYARRSRTLREDEWRERQGVTS